MSFQSPYLPCEMRWMSRASPNQGAPDCPELVGEKVITRVTSQAKAWTMMSIIVFVAAGMRDLFLGSTSIGRGVLVQAALVMAGAEICFSRSRMAVRWAS